MRQKILVIIAAIASVLALLASTASAHVEVNPAQVGVAEFQVFTVSVPTEKDIPTVALRLVIPNGVNEVTPTVKTGWDITTQKSGDKITEIDWQNGSLPAGLRDDFSFSAQVPATPTELHWKAYQTYSDGTVVKWDATPSSSDDADGDQGPYSTTKVIDDLTSPKQHASRDKTLYVIAIAALALSLAATVRSLKTGPSSKR